MADMKQIFTYPSNSGTDWIDPNYIGNATSGLTMRVDDLLDGTYKYWSNLDPVSDLGTTNTELMKNLSKYINYYVDSKWIENLTFNDFWYDPMVVATKKLIDSENVTATAASPMVVTTSDAHEFEDGMKIDTNSIDGTWGDFITGGTFPNMYTKVINTTTLHIATDSALTDIIGFTANTPIGLPSGALDINKFYSGLGHYMQVDLTSTGPATYLDGTPITINSLTPATTSVPGTYYLKNETGVGIYSLWNEVGLSTRERTQDLVPIAGSITATATGLTNPAKITTSSPLTTDQLTVYINPGTIPPGTGGDAAYVTNCDNIAQGQLSASLLNDSPFVLTPTGGTNEYEVARARNDDHTSTVDLDWTADTVTTGNAIAVSNEGKAAGSGGTNVWSSDSVARIQYGGIVAEPPGYNGTISTGLFWTTDMKDTIADGDAVTFSTGSLASDKYWNYFPSSPYYLKESTLPGGSIYQGITWDIYKDSALTQPYTLADIPATMPTNVWGPAVITADEPSLIIENQTGLTKTIKSTVNMPDWNITIGDTLETSGYDPVANNYTVTNKSAATITLNEIAAPDVPYGTYDASNNYDVPRFWVNSSVTGIYNATGSPQIKPLNSGSGLKNMQINSYVPITPVSPTVTSGSYKLYYGGSWRNNYTIDCDPVDGTGSGASVPQLTFSSALTTEELTASISTDDGGVFYARNGWPKATGSAYANGGGTSEWTTSVQPGNYTQTGTGYFLKDLGSAGPTYNYEIYKDPSYATESDFDFSVSKGGVARSNKRSGGGLPFGADTSGTNLNYNIHSITWPTGTYAGVSMYKSGDGAYNQYYYLKVISTSVVELYTDAALTTPYTSAQFLADITTLVGAGNDLDYIDFSVSEPLALSGTYGGTSIQYTTTPHIAGQINGPRLTNSVDSGVLSYNSNRLSMPNPSGTTYDGVTTQANKLADDSNLKVTPINVSSSNVTVTLTLTDTTTGQISPASDEPYPYELDTVDIILPGNIPYSYQNVSNVKTYAAEIDTKYWEPGATSATTLASTGETSAQITIAVDGSGYLQSATLVEETDAEGRYANGNDILIPLINLPDTYVPPTPTPAELEDVWDTDDEWIDYGFAGGLKKWPRHVSPMSAEIVYNSPTIVNKSQGGVKYTRSSGHTNWRLDVTYPPMSAEDFQIFAAIAQAGQGQAMPFLFELVNKDNTSILWKDFYDTVNTTVSPLIKNAITAGDTTMLVEGFSSNEADAFNQGEVFIEYENENGHLHTSLSGTDSNIFGEAKIRTTWPFRTALSPGNKVYKNPHHAIVTLASDDFEYQVDVNNMYYMSVSFDLDNWK